MAGFLINAIPLISCVCSVLHPSILWAQRRDTVMLTVSLNDIHHEKFSLEDKAFKFSGVGGADGSQYQVEINFYQDVIPQASLMMY